MCGAPFFQQIVECGRCSLPVIEALSQDQMIVYASPAIEELTGYAPDEFVGQDWRQILIRSEMQLRADRMACATSRSFAAHENFRMRHQDGAELCLEVKLSQFGADPAFVTHYIAVLHDLTAGRRGRDVPVAILLRTRRANQYLVRDRFGPSGSPCPTESMRAAHTVIGRVQEPR